MAHFAHGTPVVKVAECGARAYTLPVAGSRNGKQDISLIVKSSHLSVGCGGIACAVSRETASSTPDADRSIAQRPHGGPESWIAQEVLPDPATTQTRPPIPVIIAQMTSVI